MSKNTRAATARRWATYVALAIVFAIGCGFLASWQFDRNESRSAQLELIETNYDQEPVAIETLLPSGVAFNAADEWRPVTLQGTYLADETQVVRNRPHGGTAAYEVLVPFQLTDGRIVAVNRGWIAPGSTGEAPESIPAAPEGEVTVTARLRPSESAPPAGRGAPEGQLVNIYLPAFAFAVGGDVVTDAYALMSEESVAGEPANAISAPSEDPGPHLSYAIQWILFAIMGFGFIWYIIRTEIKHRREDAEDAEAAAVADAAGLAPPAPRERHRRKRDKDTEDEDALLDAAGR